MAGKQRLHLVVSSLLYPAFLGGMAYKAAEQLFETPGFYCGVEGVLVAALIVHYVMDWAYTVVNKDDEEPYTRGKFMSDLVIVACLFTAFSLVLKKDVALFDNLWPLFKCPIAYLFFTKLSALVWEYSEVWKLRFYQWSAIKKMEIGTDGLLAVAYFVVGFSLYESNWQNWFFAVYVCIDATFYVLHEGYRKQHKELENVLEVSIVVTERSGE